MRASSLSPPTACTPGASARIETLIAALLDAGLASLRAAARDMQDPVRRGDPEIIHQARVAVRRMRAALHVFGRPLRRCAPAARLRRADQSLRRVGRELGEARDWDVIALSLLPAQLAALAPRFDPAALLRMRRRAQLARARANTAARRFVASGEFQDLLGRVESLQRALRQSTPDLPPTAVRRALERQDAAVMRLGARLARLGPRQRHRLRIEAKRLRYAAELCAPLCVARGRKQWINALKGLQAVLGTITDARALADCVATLGEDPALARRLEANARSAVRKQLPQAAALFMVLRLAHPPWQD